jgi:hypothetical protein
MLKIYDYLLTLNLEVKPHVSSQLGIHADDVAIAQLDLEVGLGHGENHLSPRPLYCVGRCATGTLAYVPLLSSSWSCTDSILHQWLCRPVYLPR